MQHEDWLEHPWTRIFLHVLEEEYHKHLNACVDQADNASIDILTRFRLELMAASTIKHILEYGRTGTNTS